MGRQVAIASGGACLNLCGRVFLRIAMALIERYHLVVTNGSGLMLISRRKPLLKGLFSSARLPSLLEWCRFFHTVRDTRYNLVLDFHTLLVSGDSARPVPVCGPSRCPMSFSGGLNCNRDETEKNINCKPERRTDHRREAVELSVVIVTWQTYSSMHPWYAFSSPGSFPIATKPLQARWRWIRASALA